MDAVAAGLCSDVDDGIAYAASAREKQLLFFCDAQRQGVDQRILRVARLELYFAAVGGDAEAVAVMRDAADDAVENAAVPRRGCRVGAGARGNLPEAQRIEHGNGIRAHGEDVAQDPAYACRRALERLDVAGMIVRFDLEDRKSTRLNSSHT